MIDMKNKLKKTNNDDGINDDGINDDGINDDGINDDGINDDGSNINKDVALFFFVF